MNNALEIEVKVLGVDTASLIRAIESAGGTCIAPLARITDSFYDFPDARLRMQETMVRVRSSAMSTEITCKGPHVTDAQLKVRPEHTVRSDAASADSAHAMLVLLGMTCVSSQEKDRASYTVHGVRIDIDQYPHVPAYAEIEGPSEDAIHAAIASLGLGEYRLSTFTTEELYTQYRSAEEWKHLRFTA